MFKAVKCLLAVIFFLLSLSFAAPTVLAQETIPDDGKFNILFIGENYTKNYNVPSYNNMNSFINDTDRLMKALYGYEPFSTRKNQIAYSQVENTDDLNCGVVVDENQQEVIKCDEQKILQKVSTSGKPRDKIIVVINRGPFAGPTTSVYGNASKVGGTIGYVTNRDLSEETFIRTVATTLGIYPEIPLLNSDGPLDGVHANCYAGTPPASEWNSVVGVFYKQGCYYPNWYSAGTSIMQYPTQSSPAKYFNQVSIKWLNAELDKYANTAGTPRSELIVYASGRPVDKNGEYYPKMTVSIFGQTTQPIEVQTDNMTGQFQEFRFTYPGRVEADAVRISFINSTFDKSPFANNLITRDLTVKGITVINPGDEAAFYSTKDPGTYASGFRSKGWCDRGFAGQDTLTCNGFFEFRKPNPALNPTPTPIPTPTDFPMPTATPNPSGSPAPSSSPAPSPAPSGSPAPADLLGHWRMDETSWRSGFLDVIDSSIYTHHGVAHNGANTTSPGAINRAGLFDGIDDFVRVPYAYGITDNFTLAAWVKRNAVSDFGSIISKGNGIDDWDFDMGICQAGVGSCGTSNDNVFFFSTHLTPYTSISAGTISDDNLWHHVAVTRVGSTVAFYIDGAPSGTSTLTGGFIGVGNYSLTIGNDGPAWDSRALFNGKIDDVRIYRVALDSSQVGTLYAESAGGLPSSDPPPPSPTPAPTESPTPTPTPGPTNGLVSYWNMDEPSWNGTLNEVLNLINPQSNGTAVGGATTVIGKFGNAGIFDGINDYVNALNSSSFSFVNDYTLAAWIRRSSLSDYGSIIAKTSGTANDWDFDMGICQANVGSCGGNNDNLFFHSTALSPYTVVATGSISDTQNWHHVAVTRTGTTTSFYIDGVLSGQAQQGGNSGNHNYGIRIGSDGIWSAASYFGGAIDEARIYNRALSSDEITALYNLVP